MCMVTYFLDFGLHTVGRFTWEWGIDNPPSPPFRKGGMGGFEDKRGKGSQMYLV